MKDLLEVCLEIVFNSWYQLGVIVAQYSSTLHLFAPCFFFPSHKFIWKNVANYEAHRIAFGDARAVFLEQKFKS